MTNSNLRQKSGNVWKREDWLVGDGAGDLLLEDEGREDGVSGGQRTKLVSQTCKKK
jgi:hypothetical protein